MKKLIIWGLNFIISTVIFTDCKSEKNTVDPVCLVDNGKQISYKNDISPILIANCNRCHASRSGSGGIYLDNYSDVKFYCENQYIIESITIRDNGTPAMPRGGRLTDCEIVTIKSWIEQGIKNN